MPNKIKIKRNPPGNRKWITKAKSSIKFWWIQKDLSKRKKLCNRSRKKKFSLNHKPNIIIRSWFSKRSMRLRGRLIVNIMFPFSNSSANNCKIQAVRHRDSRNQHCLSSLSQRRRGASKKYHRHLQTRPILSSYPQK